MYLSVVIGGTDYCSPIEDWGDRLPSPVSGQPYTVILREDHEWQKHPQAHPDYLHVSGIRTKPVQKIIYAGEQRVVIEAGNTRFCFQLQEQYTTHDRAIERLIEMEEGKEVVAT